MVAVARRCEELGGGACGALCVRRAIRGSEGEAGVVLKRWWCGGIDVDGYLGCPAQAGWVRGDEREADTRGSFVLRGGGLACSVWLV
ncbi:hypothetical protein Tco_0164470 [Tanacetum coccineum]